MRPAARRTTRTRARAAAVVAIAARRGTRARTTARRGQRMEITPSGRRKIPGRLGARTTTEHEFIKRWAEERGGWPATVIRSVRGKGAGILRIDFPGYKGEGTLKPVSWDEWFQTFEDRNLAFLYQDKTAAGTLSRFFKLVERPKKSR